MVNSIGMFPMADLVSCDPDNELAKLVIEKYCEWAQETMLGYPMA